MTQPIKVIIDEKTKRKRGINSVYVDETIKKRLNQNINSHVIYEGDEDEDLTEVRKKLQHSTDGNLQIRGNKIYEIRRKLTKMELIQKTIKETIEIMKEKELVNSEKSVDDLTIVVFNKFLGGSERRRFKLGNNNETGTAINNLCLAAFKFSKEPPYVM